MIRPESGGFFIYTKNQAARLPERLKLFIQL